MISLVLSTVLVLIAYQTTKLVLQWRRNIAKVKASGVPYIVTPSQVDSYVWMALSLLLMPALQRLPTRWTEDWLPLLSATWAWTSLSDPFDRLNTDTFLTASPSGTYMTTRDPAVITQITTRRADFLKPVDVYIMVAIFGPNVVTTEGGLWRVHRKLTAPSFNERSNALVWSESLHQTARMLEYWAGLEEGNGPDCMRVGDVAEGAAWLSLHVISRAGFGVRLYWPHESGAEGVVGLGAPEPPVGHTMAFKEALNRTLHGALFIGIFGADKLAWSPFQGPRKISEAYFNTKKYFEELVQLKKAELRGGGSDKETMDLLSPLLTPSKPPTSGTTEAEPTLTDEEIIGNLFIFLFAGHETTSNTILSALTFLACTPASQSRLQADIARLLGPDTPPESWAYAANISSLYGSMLGAVINEVLRLMPSVILIPKRASAKEEHVLVSGEGREIRVPGRTFVHVNVVAAGRDPRHWPHGPSRRNGGREHDLDDFVPERWLVGAAAGSGAAAAAAGAAGGAADAGAGEPDGTNIEAPGLFAPKPGAFTPFSLGPRACMGRRFAVVEVVAILAVIFQRYSVELDVGEWASEEEVERMGTEERRAVYAKAVERAWWMVENDCESLITLKMKGRVPVRLVRRGRERFW